MKLKKIIYCIFMLILIFGFSGCKSKDTAKEVNKKNVKPIEVKKSEITIKDEFAGKVASIQQTGVVSKVSGVVSKVFVDVGDKVNKGDLLFELDSIDFEAQLHQAEAAVETAKAGLNRTEGSNLSQLQIQYDTLLNQAQLNYDDAQKSYNKIKTLYDSGAISKNDLDMAETRMNLAKEQLDSASSNAELLKKGIGPDSIEGAQVQLKQANAALELVRNQVNNSKIYAPIDGVISSKDIDIGEGVSPGIPAMEISDVNNLVVDLNIPEKLINKLKVGQIVPLEFDITNKQINGEISNIDPVAQQKSSDYTVRLKLSGNNSEIKPGMFCKAEFPTEVKTNVLAVPNNAIVTENGIQYVLAVIDGTIKKKDIQTGLSNDKITEVVHGLNEGDKIITEGQSFLNEGEAVKILNKAFLK